MTTKTIMRIFRETAYSRTGGSEEELRCARYIAEKCRELGLEAKIEPFAVDMANIKEARLEIDGKPVECRGYLLCGSETVEAELCYLRNTDPYSLSLCRGKIVMIDGRIGYWLYQDIVDNGAVGFITYSGDANYSDREIDLRELRSYVSKGRKIPGVNINVKSAVPIIGGAAKSAKIVIDQDEYEGESSNVVAEIKGETDEAIVFTAHYDSTFLSQGAYDNMSGSIGVLGLAEYFVRHPSRYTLRFIWCGSEERGLLGSKAYVASLGDDEIKKIVLNINLDMIGSTMGKFIACCSAEDKLVNYIEYFAQETGFGMAARQGVYSSDSTPFADRGVPSLSFARLAPNNVATIHNSYDTLKVMSASQMQRDIEFICAFSQRMASAKKCPVAREIPDEVKKKLDYYMFREREKK